MADLSKDYQPVLISKEFDSSVDQVWKAWTDPEIFAKWWSPEGFEIPVCELDVRVDGVMRVDMKGPDGTIYPSSGKYVEVEKPKKLVFVTTPTDNEGQVLFEVKQTVDFVPSGDGTRINMKAEVLMAKAEAAPYLAGMEQGIGMALTKLSKLV